MRSLPMRRAHHGFLLCQHGCCRGLAGSAELCQVWLQRSRNLLGRGRQAVSWRCRERSGAVGACLGIWLGLRWTEEHRKRRPSGRCAIDLDSELPAATAQKTVSTDLWDVHDRMECISANDIADSSLCMPSKRDYHFHPRVKSAGRLQQLSVRLLQQHAWFSCSSPRNCRGR